MIPVSLLECDPCQSSPLPGGRGAGLHLPVLWTHRGGRVLQQHHCEDDAGNSFILILSVVVPRVERVGGVGPVQRQLWAGGPEEEEEVQPARGVRGGGQRGEGVQGGVLSGVDRVGSLVLLLVLLWTGLQEQGQALCCAWRGQVGVILSWWIPSSSQMSGIQLRAVRGTTGKQRTALVVPAW